jgi:hypothetical protein
VNGLKNVASLGSVTFPFMPNVANFPGVNLHAVNITIPKPNAPAFFTAHLPPVASYFANASGAIKNQTVAQAKAWANQINATTVTMPTILQDYNPPPIVVDTPTLNVESDTFLANTKVALGQPPSVDIGDKFNSSIDLHLPTNINVLSSVHFSFMSFGGKFSFLALVDASNAIVWISLVIDYMWRIYKSGRTALKFFSASAMGIPTVDVRQFKTTKKTPSNLRFWRIITHPYVLTGGMLVLATLGIYALTLAYIPVYQQYKEGCVRSNNGTLITNNSYSFAYNFAAQDGNDDLLLGLHRFDSNRAGVCGTYTQRYTKTATDQETAVSQSTQNANEAGAKIDLINKCLLNASFDLSTPGLTNVSTLRNPLNIAAAGVNCSSYVAPEMAGAFFNCSHLALCNVVCQGPNPVMLRSSTFTAGCDSEWLFHASLFRFLLTILVYVSLNVSRTFILLALCRLNWRALTPMGFNFVGSCSRAGVLASFVKDKLQKQVHVTVRRFEKQAVVFLILAVGVHVPYILLFSVLQEDLRPHAP